MHLYRSDLAVAVFRNNTLGCRRVAEVGSLILFIIIIGIAIEKKNYIGVLLYRTRFSQVGKSRLMRFSFCLRSAGKLGAGDDRYFQFLCHYFEISGYFRNLLNTAFGFFLRISSTRDSQ